MSHSSWSGSLCRYHGQCPGLSCSGKVLRLTLMWAVGYIGHRSLAPSYSVAYGVREVQFICF